MSAEQESIEIVWEAPPPKPDRIWQMYEAALAEIKRHPGRWARLRVLSQAQVSNTKRKLRSRLDDERWEFRSAKLDEGYGLYVRYRNDDQMKAT